MASPYTSSRSAGGGSVYTRSSGTRSGSAYVSGGGGGGAGKAKKPPHGVLGLVENLGHDVAGAVVGIPAGIVQTVEHPVRTAKAVGKGYKQTYSPLVHGDVSGFLHQLYTHPLGPALDFATVLTLGSAGLAKAGVLSSEAVRLELRSPALVAGQEGETVGRLSSRNPAIRARQQLIHKALNRLPYETGHVGEAVRYAREAQRLPRQTARQLAMSPEARAYTKATRNLSGEQMAALHLIGNNLHPLDYAAALKKLQAQGGHVDPAALKVLEHPGVIHAFEHPDAKLQKAIAAAENLAAKDVQVKVQHKILTSEAAAARVAKHQPEVQQLLGEMRPTPNRPFYVPDVPTYRRVSNPAGQKFGGGGSQPKGTVRQNQSVLFHTGRLALTPDLLGPKFLETTKYALADDIHTTLVAGAARISHAEATQGLIPKGWEFVPKTVLTKTGSKTAQKIHPLVKGAHQALREKEMILPPGQQLADTFKVTDISNAATLHGDYLIVPSKLKREMIGEFHRSNNAIRQFIDRPMKVWRSLVLGLRVGFLTNNLVGNHLLFALHAAGVDGLRAYLNAVKREKGTSVVRSLLDDHALPPALRERFMAEFFPEQESGAFGYTQRPEPGKYLRGKKGRKVRALTTGVLPVTQAVAETSLRRALVEKFIRSSPEFKNVYRSMETKDFETAAGKVLRGEGGPDFQRQISDQVNNVLGDYINLGPTEQNVLRQIFPFYSWYKAISRITLRLAFDNPARAQILVKLGQLGQADTLNKLGALPSFLQGVIPLGGEHGGHAPVLTTRGLNPFVTVSDIGSGFAGLVTGKPGETGKAFSQLGPSPFLTGAIENLTGKQLFSGHTVTGGRLGLPGAILSNVGTQLPQAQLIAAARGTAPASKLYGPKTLRAALLSYLGAPVRDLNVSQAHTYARKHG